MAKKQKTPAAQSTKVVSRPRKSRTSAARATRGETGRRRAAMTGSFDGKNKGPQVEGRKMSAKWGNATTRIARGGGRLRRVLVDKQSNTNNQHYWVRVDRD